MAVDLERHPARLVSEPSRHRLHVVAVAQQLGGVQVPQMEDGEWDTALAKADEQITGGVGVFVGAPIKLVAR